MDAMEARINDRIDALHGRIDAVNSRIDPLFSKPGNAAWPVNRSQCETSPPGPRC